MVGQFPKYVELREHYKAKGHSTPEAWRMAYKDVMGEAPEDAKDGGEGDIKEVAQPLVDELKRDKAWVSKNGSKVTDVILRTYIKEKVGTRQAPTTKVINWVFNASGKELCDLTTSEVPSVGAFRLWEHVKRSNENYADFIQHMWSKTIPTKQQLEMEDRMKDNGKKTMTIIESALKEFTVAPVPAQDG